MRKQYAKNYFEAKQEKGREKADLMFPPLSAKQKEEPVEELSEAA
ncbi:hypothetical protein ACFL5S_01085 [Fibrobacterota bacterium]